VVRKLPLWIEKEGGLRFQCTRCGACCRGGPGYVWVDDAEIAALAAHLGLDREQFGRRYLRRVGDRISLLEKRTAAGLADASHDCVFWDEGRGCKVYEARPGQCRTFPFWPEVIRSRQAWRSESVRCPGMRAGPGARLYGPGEILALANGEGET
jgi:Fe-S-cluster containining protein